jgi:hypothetical protein
MVNNNLLGQGTNNQQNEVKQTQHKQ